MPPNPPPLPPTLKQAAPPQTAPEPPPVASTGPTGSLLVKLLIFNGAPFMDHWAYWVRSSRSDSKKGILMHAVGDVRDGFVLEIHRSYDFDDDDSMSPPDKRIPLQWVDAKYLDEKAMFNDWGEHKLDDTPVCEFEGSALKVKAPEKSLNPVDDRVNPHKKFTGRNCQTWIVESAEQLVKDKIFSDEVVLYLQALKQ
ncbi:hypothetical protein FQN54_009632 [Arachnomyces sp. PD_36]|nr:hypothetical protein FQN54_009632 [Arachnomyces sp. PD_36]